jgi:hypothetical protein
VLKAYVALRKLEPEAWKQINTIKPVIVKMIIEMRKDLGLGNQGLGGDELFNLATMNLESSGLNQPIAEEPRIGV